ncbi:hypothetical protein D3C71_1786070 [compost metagenome]
MNAHRIRFGQIGDCLAGEGGAIAVIHQRAAFAAFPATRFQRQEFLHAVAYVLRLPGNGVGKGPEFFELSPLPAHFPQMMWRK